MSDAALRLACEDAIRATIARSGDPRITQTPWAQAEAIIADGARQMMELGAYFMADGTVRLPRLTEH